MLLLPLGLQRRVPVRRLRALRALAMFLLCVGVGPFAPSPMFASNAASRSFPVKPYVYVTASSATSYDVMLTDGVNKDRMAARVKVDGVYFGDVTARLSKDGGMVAFRVSGDRVGGSSLWVVDVKTGEYTKVAASKTAGEGIGSYAWSPAGRTAAFVRAAPALDPPAADTAFGTVYLYSTGFEAALLKSSHGSDRVLTFSGDGLGVYVARREYVEGVALEHLVYLPLSGEEGMPVMHSRPDLKYSSFSVWTAPGRSDKVAALVEGNFSMAQAGAVPAGSLAANALEEGIAAVLRVITGDAMLRRTGETKEVSTAGLLARKSGLGLAVSDPAGSTSTLLRRDAEAYPYVDWAPDGKTVIVGGTRTGAAWAVDLQGNRRSLDVSLSGMAVRSWSDDGLTAVLSDMPTSRLVTLDFKAGDVLLSKEMGYSKVGATAVALKVPYIHQVNDTAANGDGNWACGPTSVAMALAYYGKLAPRQGLADEAKPAAATAVPTVPPIGADYAPFITGAYTYNGHSYTATARDPRGNLLAGLYGTICPSGLADWGMMRQVLDWHGLGSVQVAATWEGIVGALKRGHPVLLGNMLTSEGHILLVIGYTNDGNLLVNDPYGNRFAPGYGSNNGKGLLYPWKRVTPRTALEVVGIYPPPTPLPTSTPLPTATATATPTAFTIHYTPTLAPASAPASETPFSYFP